MTLTTKEQSSVPPVPAGSVDEMGMANQGVEGRGSALTFSSVGAGQRARASFTAKTQEGGHLPAGGRGRLEGRGESEEACLSWRQGGSPS